MRILFLSERAAGRISRSLLLIFGCLLIWTSALAGQDDKIKDYDHYVKVIAGDSTLFECDKYTTTILDTRDNSEIQMEIAHPILSAVAYCPSPEETYYSKVDIYSRISDEWFYDPTPLFWRAKVWCEDQYGQTKPPEKVIMFCWSNEMDSGFPIK